MTQTTATEIAKLIREQPTLMDASKDKRQALIDSPEVVAFFERVAPLLDAGWSRDSASPDLRVNKIIRNVILCVASAKEGQLWLSFLLLYSGAESLYFDTPEEILEFVAEVEKELELLPV